MARIAVVTGGSAGIGLATAERLARTGYDVAIIARDEARPKEARAMLAAHGRRVLAIGADVADAAAIDAAADRIEREGTVKPTRHTPAQAFLHGRFRPSGYAGSAVSVAIQLGGF